MFAQSNCPECAAMEQDGEVVPVPVDDELMDTLFPILVKELKVCVNTS
jgi:hypothetical protein